MTDRTPTTDAFEAWGLLELFGHQRLAGRLSEQTIGGVHFIRIDVPESNGQPGYTRFFTQGAIYGMSPMDEATTRKLAASLHAVPVRAYELPPQDRPQLGAHEDDDDRPF